MNLVKLVVLLAGVALASGGIGAALAETRNSSNVEAIDIAARKNDVDDDIPFIAGEDDDDNGDGDLTRGNDGTAGGDNTRAPAPVRAAGDGDNTRGNDGTSGGDNTRAVAPAPAPAPAPQGHGGGTTGGGDSGGGGSVSGGGDT